MSIHTEHPCPRCGKPVAVEGNQPGGGMLVRCVECGAERRWPYMAWPGLNHGATNGMETPNPPLAPRSG